MNYYEAALKSSGDASLRHDLCELLFRLRRYDKCEKVIRSSLDGTTRNAGALTLSNSLLGICQACKSAERLSQSDEAKLHSLMARLRLETGNDLEAERELTTAKDLQVTLGPELT